MTTETVTLIISCVGILVGLLNAYFIAKTARTSKYIDTITSERIKWIEKVRDEVSDLYSIFVSLIKNTFHILNLDEKQNIDDTTSDRLDVIKAKLDAIRMSSKLNAENSTYLIADVSKKINIIKLRLNPVEDKEALEKLAILQLFLLGKRDREDIDRAFNANEDLLELIQTMLKNEWEKVKKEARKIF